VKIVVKKREIAKQQTKAKKVERGRGGRRWVEKGGGEGGK